MPYSYELAKGLADNDKNRLIAVLLSTDNLAAHADWQLATDTFGSASIDSMKKCYQNTLKKITTDSTGSVPTVHAPKKSKSKTAASLKRKTDATDGETADNDDSEKTMPSPKKRGRPSKKALAAAAAAKAKAEAEAEEVEQEGDSGESDGGVAIKGEESA